MNERKMIYLDDAVKTIESFYRVDSDTLRKMTFELKDLPSAQPEQNGWVHIDDIYRLISGHSNYHGDNILAALTCLAEGKEVLKPITVLDTQPEKSTTEEKSQLAEEKSTRKLIYLDGAIDAIEMLLEQSEDDEHDKTWNDAIRGSINAIKHHVHPHSQKS